MNHRQLQKCILYAYKLETMHTENLKLTLTTRITDFGLPLPILPGATASCLPTSISALLRFGPLNANKFVLFADFRRFSHQIPISPQHFPPFERYGQASSAVEELMQLAVSSYIHNWPLQPFSQDY